MSPRAKFVAGNTVRLMTLLLAVSVVSFALANAAPIDPVEAYAGSENHLSQEQLDAIAAHWGFNDPPVERYLRWIGGVLTGDWGVSVIYQRPVLDVLAERSLTSLALMGTAWVFSGVLGFALGMVCGMRRDGALDRLVKGFCLTMAAAPTFWLALLALVVFSVKLGWFPMGLASSAGVLAQDVTIGDRLWHLFLPALVLSVTGIASITLQTREKAIEACESDYALFARARGESRTQFARRHVLRNIALPAITLQCASISEIFGGSILAEQVFSYPGLGNAAVEAALAGDVPLLLGVALVAALFVFFGNLLANVLYGVVDPRIRRGSEAIDG
ncbi:ABC transporter permease [Denitrobacterium detoxificans]|uniref:ABC transporter permease n=1 Tax=Denitrobacterium detoxificans TaxID=79604 RepID=UPI0026F14BF8|nr:ABC transporter permease [Denitrobacterium detoxificans]